MDQPLTSTTGRAEDRQLARTGMVVLAGAGVLGGALYLLVAFISHLPGPGDSWMDWVKFARAHSHPAQGELGLWALTVLMLLFFGIYLVTLVANGSGGWARWLWLTALIALGIRASLELVVLTLLAVPAMGNGHAFDASIADFGALLHTSSLLPHAIFLTALGGAMLITRSVPRWIAWLTLGVGAVHDMLPFVAIASSFSALAPIGVVLPVYGVIWYGSLPLWPLVTGGGLMVVALLRTGGPDRG